MRGVLVGEVVIVVMVFELDGDVSGVGVEELDVCGEGDGVSEQEIGT